MKLKTIAALFLFGSAVAHAESTAPLGLDVNYQQQTPSVEQVLGYPLGSKISSPAAIYDYFQALAEAHPEQVNIIHYGESWEGRPLYYVAVGSAHNMAALSDFRGGMQALANPQGTSESEAQRLISELPSSVWLSYGVHGNEISSPEAAILTAWHLLAATDAETKRLLDNTLVFIDPVQNPDGRARFVSRYYMTAGMEHSADRISAEHNEPWPSGRSNHYLFDLNRDWIALTQPEVAGQVDALLETFPLIFVDLHEMSGDQSYYFTPEARPYNPLIAESQRDALWDIGENNGKWFDKLGYDYFTREIFDAFYPGYGASWPLYHGTLAMTYEMASARGHKFRTRDGDVLTYGDGVQRHFVASLATIETASQQRERLLRDFWNYRKQALADGKASKERYIVIDAQPDAAGSQRLAGLLSRHGVTVQRAEQSFEACGTNFSAGSFVIDNAQPAHYMARTLLDEQVDMAADFLAEQERRRSQNLPDQIYDVTGWSLPLMFNLEQQRCARIPRLQLTEVGEQLIAPGSISNLDAKVAFLARWGDMNTGRLLTAALRAGLQVKQSDLPFTLKNGDRYPAGSLIFTRADNNAQLASELQALAGSTGAHITGVDTSWVVDGPNFGSDNVQQLHAPRIALAWDEPFSSLNTGHTRFIIERQFNYPVTAIRAEQLRQADLSRYQVLILPAVYGNLQATFGEQGQKNIQQWVERGGVLITMSNATQWAVDAGLLASALEQKAQAQTVDVHSEPRVSGMLLESVQHLHNYENGAATDPYWTSGVLTQLDVDQEHWLTAGVPETVNALTVGNQIYRPLTINNGRNLMNYAAEDELLVSGYLWQENKQQLAYKPYLMWQPRGRGMVISFAQEPTYRAYLDGLNITLMNAIFGGASHATPLR
ncbi:M14 family metallopeptidase [Pseudidiomarina insulisalsae]|uniref:Peptidase M14 n=1 Tax=Pseudidiomarina insulisalsae TaxID=575789 RepID=A0A432YGZ3_9GAMM|nr:M14 family metallopeptidase [Pseudidiomarina insulisalsae]RUO60229.1 peptidase M14 [Pseudidiomarina insulisalsae]